MLNASSGRQVDSVAHTDDNEQQNRGNVAVKSAGGGLLWSGVDQQNVANAVQPVQTTQASNITPQTDNLGSVIIHCNI